MTKPRIIVESDLQKITAWLTRKGFTVEKVAANFLVIEFSRTAGQVRNAFATGLWSEIVPLLGTRQDLNGYPIYVIHKLLEVLNENKE